VVYYLIMCRSLTHAQNIARNLELSGITSVVMRPPRGVSEYGCTYCVKISENKLSEALIVLKTAGLNYSRIYILHSDGSSGEVAL